MHDYSVDTSFRRNAYVLIAILSLTLPSYLLATATLLGMPKELTFPVSFGATFALLHFLFNHFVWKWLSFAHEIPDLSGKWVGSGISSYEDPETGKNLTFTMEIRIRQTFSRMEVFTETADSTSRSFMGSIETQHAMKLFRYGFENIPKNMSNAQLQRHPGMMDFRVVSKDRLEGDYFSGKHRLRFGTLNLQRTGK